MYNSIIYTSNRFVCNIYVETKVAFATSINTWWFMFFAWSLKLSVPFSGYVNTEEKRGSGSFMDPVTMFWNHDWKLWFLTPCNRAYFTPAFSMFSVAQLAHCLLGASLTPCAGSAPPALHTHTLAHASSWHILLLAWQLHVYNWVSLGSALLMNRNHTLKMCWCLVNISSPIYRSRACGQDPIIPRRPICIGRRGLHFLVSGKGRPKPMGLVWLNIWPLDSWKWVEANWYNGIT